MASIDFLIIGAQKSGTTALFEYMRRHPQIHMPAEKEISFFSNWYDRGWDWYIATVLRNAPPDAICGEASIAYMVGTPFANVTQNDLGYRPSVQEADKRLENVIPERIKACLPGVRLICVLRNPVTRAYSHYQMAVLDRAESRTFGNAIKTLMTPKALSDARITPTSTNGYIVNGEYYRILSGFYKVFPRDQLLVMFSDELSDDPVSALARVFAFIGAKSDVVPDNVNTRYRTAATDQRVPGLDLYAWQKAIATSGLLRTLWHRLPGPLRAKVDRSYSAAGYRTTMWNARRHTPQEHMSAHTSATLAEHFLPDSQALSQLIGLNVTWLADWQES